MITRIILAATTASLAIVSGATGDIVIIDFEQDPAGPKPNGFFSVDSPLVSFTDSNDSDLLIADFGIESIGQGLAVGTDIDNSILIMDFTAVVDSLSLAFGNDDPALSLPGDFAQLTLFLNGSEVGQVNVEMNRDSAMNQTISFAGEFFNSATIQFYASSDGITEVVDNITFNTIPGPGVGPVGLIAMVAVGGRRRRR